MELKVNAHPEVKSTDNKIQIRCPACRQRGTFDTIQSHDIRVVDYQNQPYVTGQRICPDPACRSHVFFIRDPNGSILSYPPETFDFDSTDIPSPVLAAMKEAISCHAHECWIASAIMIRKTLEEICKDKGASGKNLKERITSLGTKIVLPKEMLEALHDLRLLGNDAAHIESEIFAKVGQDEVEVSLEVCKEILKAVYQYSSIMSKLAGLKKEAPVSA